jgi:hypothetical protein
MYRPAWSLAATARTEKPTCADSGWETTVAIYRLLQDAAFGSDEIERITAAYESVLKLLRLSDRTDPITELIAQRVIETARKGEPDPARISSDVMTDFGISLPE